MELWMPMSDLYTEMITLEFKEHDSSTGQSPTLLVHRNLLTRSSAFFNNALKNETWTWKEGEQRKVMLPLNEYEEANMYCQWLYTVGKHCLKAQPNDLIKLFIFGDKYQIPYLCRHAVLAMQWHTLNNWCPTEDQICRIYEHSPENSSLRKVAVYAFGLRTVAKGIYSTNLMNVYQNTPAEFARDLLQESAKRGGSFTKNDFIKWGHVDLFDVKDYDRYFQRENLQNTFNDELPLNRILKFHLAGRQVGFIHLKALCCPAKFCKEPFPILEASMFTSRTFSCFCHWGYSGKPPTVLSHLIECHKSASLFVKEQQSEDKEVIREVLKYRMTQFKDAIIDGIAMFFRIEDNSISIRELIESEAVSDDDSDSLRKLLADIIAWRTLPFHDSIGRLGPYFIRDIVKSMFSRMNEMEQKQEEFLKVLGEYGDEGKRKHPEGEQGASKKRKTVPALVKLINEIASVGRLRPPYEIDTRQYHEAHKYLEQYQATVNTTSQSNSPSS
jgi:hypothetical protein